MISHTSLWKALNRRKWLRLLLIAMVYFVITTTLFVCYLITAANGHLRRIPGLPAISLLGDYYPEHIVFALGFSLMAAFIALPVFYRAGQLDFVSPDNCANNVFLALPVIGLPAIVAMGLIPEGSHLGAIHFISAAIGLGLLSLWCLFTSLLALVFLCQGKPVDPALPTMVRIGCYLLSVIAAIAAPLLFGKWMTNVHITVLEWSGVSLCFVSFLPFFILLAPDSGIIDVELLPVNAEKVGLLPSKQSSELVAS
jgi:hypothetical protein